MKTLVPLALCLFSITSCKTVKPWQRGTLGSRHMQLRVAPEAEQYTAEVHNISEGTTFSGSASATAGAGCGCQ